MRAWIFLLALLTLARAVGGQSSVPLEIADGGYLFVTVTVADGRSARLLLDTGAGINTFSTSLLQSLGSAAKRAGLHTGTRHNGERVTGPLFTITSVALGALRQTDVTVGEFAPQGADGLLSMDFFRRQPVTLDLARGQLILESEEHTRELATRAAVIPIRLKPNGPHELDFFVRMCFGDSVSADAEFDTGAGYNMLMLTPAYMPKLGTSPGTAPKGGLEYYVHSTFLPEMHLCDAPAIRSTNQFVGFKAGLIYEGLVGHGIFKGKRVTIDIPRQRLLAW